MRNSIKLGVLTLLASTALISSADAAPLPNSNAIRTAIDELSIVARYFALNRGERRARIRIASRRIQLNRAAEVELVTLPDDEVA